MYGLNFVYVIMVAIKCTHKLFLKQHENPVRDKLSPRRELKFCPALAAMTLFGADAVLKSLNTGQADDLYKRYSKNFDL